MIACLYKLLQNGLRKSQILQKHGLLLVVQFGNLLLDLSTDNKYFAMFSGGKFPHLRHLWIGGSVVRKILFRHIGSIDHRLIRQQIVCAEQGKLILIGNLHGLGRRSALQMSLDTIQQIQLLRTGLVHPGRLRNL